MNMNLVTTVRVLCGCAALSLLPFPAPLYGATPGLPFVEEFQSQSFLDSTRTTARWSSSGVTLGFAQGRHAANIDLNRESFPVGHPSFRVGHPSSNTRINDIALHDMNNNGHLDVLIASDRGIWIYFTSATSTAGRLDSLGSIRPVRISTEVPFAALAIGDFDRDGDLDVAALGDPRAVLLFVNNGSGIFEAGNRISNLRTIALVAADMDGDDDLDLVLARNGARAVHVHRNEGDGNFIFLESAVSPTWGNNRGLGVGDLDGDGKPDIVVSNSRDRNIFHLNEGGNEFSDVKVLRQAGGNEKHRNVALGDVNADGHLDIVIGVREERSLLYLNDGHASFSTGSRIAATGRTFGMELADMDGDGDLDIVEASRSEGTRIYLNDGNGGFGWTGLTIHSEVSTLAVGDVDGDGNQNVVLGRTLSTLRVVRFVGRLPRSSIATMPPYDTGHGWVVSGKINGDEPVPHVVFLTATVVEQVHTDIEYYLSSNGGENWRRAYRGGVVRFSPPGNDLRWRARLKSRSPVLSTTLTRIGIESVLRVSIDGEIFGNNGIFTATSHTIGEPLAPVPVRLMNLGDRALVVSGIETAGQVFRLEDRQGNAVPRSINIKPGNVHELRLVFDPERRPIAVSTLTVSGHEVADNEAAKSLPKIEVGLRGQGLAPEIDVKPRSNLQPIRVGNSQRHDVKIQNKGDLPLRVSTPTVAHPAFSLINAAAFPTTVTAGSPVTAQFRFTPTARGTATALVTIASNDVISGTQTAELKGTGAAPGIKVLGTAIDFGSVRPGNSVTRSVMITNPGDWPLIVAGVEVLKPDLAQVGGYLSWVPPFEGATSQTVAPSITESVVLRFAPTTRVRVDAGLLILSDALGEDGLGEPVKPIRATGEGVAPEIAVVITETGVVKVDDVMPSVMSYDFGDVRVGGSSSAKVFISNVYGTTELRVTSARIHNKEHFPPVKEDFFPINLDAGSSAIHAFDISFEPTSRGVKSTTLTVVSDAFNGAQTIVLQGKGVGAEIGVSVSSMPVTSSTTHTLGRPLKVGVTDTISVTIHNRGERLLKIASVSLSNGDNKMEDLGFREEIRAMSSARMEVGLVTNMVGPFVKTLEITSDDPAVETYRAWLAGTGVVPTMVVEVNGNEVSAGGEHNFGEVQVNGTTSARVVIRNTGDVPLELDMNHPVSITTTTADFVFLDRTKEQKRRIFPPLSKRRELPSYRVTDSDTHKMISVSNTYTFTLNFIPRVPSSEDNALLTIRSDDPDHPDWTLNLKGSGRGALVGLMVSGTTPGSLEDIAEYDMGKTLINPTTPARMEIYLESLGNEALEINNFVMAPGSEGFQARRGLIVTRSGGAWHQSNEILFDPERPNTHTGTLLIGSNDRAFPELRIGLRGYGAGAWLEHEYLWCYQPSANLCLFGDTYVGRRSGVTMIFKNAGNEDLVVSDVRVSQNMDPFFSISAGETPQIIQPGHSSRWTLQFAPTSEDTRRVGLFITANQRNTLPWFRFHGSSEYPPNPPIPPGLAFVADGRDLTPAGEYYFGWRPVSVTTSVVMSIRNTGATTLALSSIEAATEDFEFFPHTENQIDRIFPPLSERHKSAYTIDYTHGAPPETIPVNGSYTFTLNFHPSVPSEKEDGLLQIKGNSPDSMSWALPLRGVGAGPLMQVSLFHSDGAPVHLSATDTQVYEMTKSPVRLAYPAAAFIRVRNLGNVVLRVEDFRVEEGQEHFRIDSDSRSFAMNPHADFRYQYILFRPKQGGIHTGKIVLKSTDSHSPEFSIRLRGDADKPRLAVAFDGCDEAPIGMPSYPHAPRVMDCTFDDVVAGAMTTATVTLTNVGYTQLAVSSIAIISMDSSFMREGTATRTIGASSSEAWTLKFAPLSGPTGMRSARLHITGTHVNMLPQIHLRGNVVAAAPQSGWADSVPQPAVPTFVAAEDTDAPRFVGLGFGDGQSRLWLAFDEPAEIRTGADADALSDGTALPGFAVLPNYSGGGSSGIGVVRALYQGGGVAIDLARAIVSSDTSVWVRYTPPPLGQAGIHDTSAAANRISAMRVFALRRSTTSDYDNDGIPDALEARLGGNPLLADDAVADDVPQIALSRTGVEGAPVAVAYSAIRADGAAAHLGVATTGAETGVRLVAYYLSDTFGYSGGYAADVSGYGCTGRFPSNYASPLSQGGCALVDFSSIRAGVEHRIGWLAMSAAADASGYWAVVEDTQSRLPEQVIVRVPEFNMSHGSLFFANSAASDATVEVGAFHDGPASLQLLTVSLSNVAAAAVPSSIQPDGFRVAVTGSVAGVVTDYAIADVQSGDVGKLWRVGDSLSSLTADKYSLGRVTQTRVVRLHDDNLPPLFGRASLYAGSTASAHERHAVVVGGAENYIALLPVVTIAPATATAAEVLPWGGVGGIIRMGSVSSPDGSPVRIAFRTANPLQPTSDTVSVAVSVSGARSGTATTVLSWPVTGSADAWSSISGDGDGDGIPDVLDSYRALNRLPVSVVGGLSGSPDRRTAGADSWHHIRSLLPLHSQSVGVYAQRAGIGQTSGYSDFSVSLTRDEFSAMAPRHHREDVAAVYNFRVHGVDPVTTQGAVVSGGRAGVVIPLPESLYQSHRVFPLHYAGGGWVILYPAADESTATGFSPLRGGVCPDDSGVAGSSYRDGAGSLKVRKQAGDACLVVYLSDGGVADRDGHVNGTVEALLGLAVTVPAR